MAITRRRFLTSSAAGLAGAALLGKMTTAEKLGN
ncbi:MAG: twin-arginine translocation signal domain-containing protein [Phycisphaerae bacterium]|nr:twin-arginine translocation signal domain-containing protein [Phycisphaerae bacterium]